MPPVLKNISLFTHVYIVYDETRYCIDEVQSQLLKAGPAPRS
jgi:hypothetical protein